MLEPREFVLYLRKSKGYVGIDRQRRETTREIDRTGGQVVAEFIDVDTTAYARPGQRPERDQYTAMLAFLRADRRTPPLAVGARATDRLNRSTADADELIAVASEGGHIVVTARSGTYDLSTAAGRRRFGHDSVDAAGEVDLMTERILDQKLDAVAQGAWLGGHRPFGFKKDGTRHRRREARAIDAAADAVLGGVPVSQVVRDWDDAGFTGTSGGAWCTTTARRVLLHPRNAGLMSHHGTVTGRAQWLPVLCSEKYRPPKGEPLTAEAEEAWRAEAEDKWRALVALLTDPDRRVTPGPEPRWLGSGLYRCGWPVDGGLCWEPMKAGATAGHRPRPIYRCSAVLGHVSRSAEVLDDWVSGLVCERLARPDAVALLEGETVDVSRLRVEKQALTARLGELAEAFAEGEVDALQLKRGTVKLKERIAEIDGRLAAVVHMSALDGIAGRPDAAAVWQSLDLARRRAILAAVVEVTVLPAPRGRPKGHVPGQPYFHPEAIRMEWTTSGG